MTTAKIQCAYTFDTHSQSLIADVERYNLISMKWFNSDDVKNNTAPYIEIIIKCTEDVFNSIQADDQITIIETEDL